jgi:secreted trypsin-like serine protease
MKLALATTIILASAASLPYAAARIGHKAFKQSSGKPIDPHKAHPAPASTLQNTTEHRIIGGEPAAPGEFPFYVKLSSCGGSLIHEDIILTAAHCKDINLESARIGAYFYDSDDTNAETRQIETGRYPSDYDEEDNWLNDVMVLKITSPSSLPTIRLNDDFASPSDGQDVTAIGLGYTDYDAETHPDALLKVNLQTVAYEQCAADYTADKIDEDVMVCAGVQEGDEGTCNGDSGGPLLELRDGEYVQVGIVSWGIEGCVAPNRPGVFTRVSGVKDWIDQMICELSENPPASCGNAECEDVPGWYDSDGPEYDCAWYEAEDACEYASGYENDGYTAVEACCFCGGGSA